MQEAKKALTIALRRLTHRDRFAICAFDDRAEWLGTDEGKYLKRVHAWSWSWFM